MEYNLDSGINTIIAIILVLFCNLNVITAQHKGLRVGMVQMDIVAGNIEENMRHAETGIRESAKMQCDLVCLPEMADFGWLYQNARRDALPIPGKYTDFLSDLARELNVWISSGCLEKDNDRTFNSAVLIDRTGKIVMKHRKFNTLPNLTAHLYDPGSPDDIKVTDTEFGCIGLTICADNHNIENPQKVADLGAWLLIAPHGYAASDTNLVDNAIQYMNHIKNVAKKTKLWVIGTDAAHSPVNGGDWKGYLHSGCSTIADPRGKAVAMGKFRESDLIIYDIPAGK